MSFSTLVATSAAEFTFWDYFNDRPVIQGCIIYFGIPLVLVIINAIKIEVRFTRHCSPMKMFASWEPRTCQLTSSYSDLWLVGSGNRQYQNTISWCYHRDTDCNQPWRLVQCLTNIFYWACLPF